jgi:phage tail-like protein
MSAPVPDRQSRLNVNGSRFHMLLGEADWGQCRARGEPLQTTWDDRADTGGTDAVDPEVPSWDSSDARITLALLPEELAATPGETVLDITSRRAAAADRHGNLYAISRDRSAIEVAGALQARGAAFWPDPRYRPALSEGTFAPEEPAAPQPSTFTSLAVTASDFLVVAFDGAEGAGLLRFDLAAGGEPEAYDLSSQLGGPVTDLASDGCGGVFLLDAAGMRILRLDGGLQPVSAAEVTETEEPFQPEGSAEPRRRPVAPPPSAVPVPAGLTPLQLVAAREGEVLVLAARSGGGSVILALDPGGVALRQIAEDKRDWIMAARTPGTDEALCFVPRTGNQAFSFAVIRTGDGLTAGLADRAALLPMRRFAGSALVPRGPALVYDSGDPARWVPLVEQRRRRFALGNTFETRIFDGREPQCVWDRVRLDACIPPGSSVRLWARASDDLALLDVGGEETWIEQPTPYLNRDGGELPGKRAIAMPATDRERGEGCWDTLLQRVRGRYARLRIELSGSGRVSPRLRALRLWFPRFSYNSRFLPAIYREDDDAADFLDRFLANLEGMNTVFEGRIAAAEAHFDPRTIRAEALDWLASWFDVMLDPAWREERRRLFLRHVTEFLGWRGTRAGLAMALRLAFDEDLDDDDFAFGGTLPQGPASIRIVENFSTASYGHRVAAGPIGAGGPESLSLGAAWSPAEGAAGLLARIGMPQLARFPLFADDAIGEEGATAALLAFGFTPQAGAAERQAWHAVQMSEDGSVSHPDLPAGTVAPQAADRWNQYLGMKSSVRDAWQQFLRRRYRRVSALNTAYAAAWDGFDDIPLPDYLPDREAAIRDWLLFEGQLLPRSRAAHRFTVLLPLQSVSRGTAELEADMALARRIVEIEKPAHTVCDIRFYWALNRIGEARLGADTELGPGSRAPELIPPAILGRAYLGSAFVGGPQGRVAGRDRLAC